MTNPKLLLTAAASVFVVACGGQDATAASQAEAAKAKPEAASTDAGYVDLSAAPSGSYSADQGHRYITFHYNHLGLSSPFLRWREWDATLDWNADDPSKSGVEVTIDASSIDSGVDKFDDHLKSADFFDVENFPTITFKSTSIDVTGPRSGVISGDLTVKDITKPVSFEATFNKATFSDRAKAHKIGFSGKTKLMRSDLGVGAYVPFVGDEVTVIIETEFEMPAASE